MYFDKLVELLQAGISVNVQKFIIGVGSMALWFYLVLVGKTEVAPFVEVLKQILMAVGIYHIALTVPKDKP